MADDTRIPFSTELQDAISGLRSAFAARRTRSYSWRIKQLRALRALCIERENEIAEALQADLGKSAFESSMTETLIVVKEIDHTISHLSKWMRAERVATPIVNQLGSSKIMREPLGVVLIIGPWNYPFQLIAAPLVGAIAAGNCALLKPSEMTPATSALLAKFIPQYMDAQAVRVLEGGVAETTAILEQRFDLIFFTGSTTVGRIVAQAAARHLTPTVLELGGKSPTIVARDANLDMAAKRIVWGKFLNAGQTCIAPDYVLVDKTVEAALIEKLRSTITEFYGTDPQKSHDYSRIVNTRNFTRVSAYLKDGSVVTGGQCDEAARYIAPTILKNVSPDSKIMQDEIFGPILPVIPVNDMEEAIEFILARPKPLALYVFTESKSTASTFLERTSSGGACVNEVVSHFAIDTLPFGGVGDSGNGAYHGRASFEAFSHRKAVHDRSTLVDPPIRYAPWDSAKQKLIRTLL